MELRHLRSFVAVAETLSFTDAARRLGMAQPPLSIHIKQLEASLGLVLFHRTSRRVELTTAGRLLLRDAIGMVRMADEAAASAQDLKDGRGGSLRIGIGPAARHPSIGKTLRKFIRRHRDIRVFFEFLDEPSLTDRLLSGSLDGAIRMDPAASDGIMTHFLIADSVALAVSRKHRLAGREAIRFTDLLGERILTTAGEADAFCESLVRRVSGALWEKFQLESSAEGLAERLWLAGLGVATTLVPASDSGRQLWVGIPIEDTRFACVFATRKESLNPGLAALLDAFRVVDGPED